MKIQGYHILKTDLDVFDLVKRGIKNYEIRFNDRNYQEGDLLKLRETRHTGMQMAEGAPLVYTGREVLATVTHVLEGPIYGLKEGWAILSIKKHK